MTGGRRGGFRFICRAGRASALAAVLLAGLLTSGVALAYSPVGPDFRISTTGNDGDLNRFPTRPDVAYNPTANEFLVVWEGDGLGGNDESEIFGQRLSAAGAEIGTDFRISNATDIASNRDADFAAVTFNPTANEYLVVWREDGVTDQVFEVFGQRVSATGVPDPQGDFQVSDVADAHAAGDAGAPDLAYNPAANEYLAVWTGNGMPTDGEIEVFGQRLSAAGVELGTGNGDFRISNVGSDTDTTRGPIGAELAYGAGPNEYLVVWNGDGLPATNDEVEVFGQRVSAAGDQFGGDFRISNVGADTNAALTVQSPAVTYGSSPNEYLVAWQGENLGDSLAEIEGQRVSVAGAQVGGDFRISRVTDVDANRDALNPSLSYSTTANEYLVAWEGDGLVTDNEIEVFGQRLDAAGTPSGAFRISTVGEEGSTGAVPVEPPGIAFGAGANEYLVTWSGNDLPTAPSEYEIFGHRLALPAAPSTTPSVQPTETGRRAAALKKCKKKKTKAARKKCRKRARTLPA